VFFFAHVSITVAAALAVDNAILQARVACFFHPAAAVSTGASAIGCRAGGQRRDQQAGPAGEGSGLPRQLDYRLIAIGAVLPDVDKLISLELLGRFDRGVFHTLLWFFILAAAALLLFRVARDTRGVQLACCWAVHLVLDEMWTNPRVLLWPLYGPMPVDGEFGVADFGDYMVETLTTDWHQLLPELVGLGIVLWVTVMLVRKGRLGDFFRMGRIVDVIAWPVHPNGRDRP